MAFVPLFCVCLIRWSEERSRILALNYLSNCSSYLQTDKHSHKNTPSIHGFFFRSPSSPSFCFCGSRGNNQKIIITFRMFPNTHVLTYNAHTISYTKSRIHNRLVSVYKRVFHNMRQKVFWFVVAKQSISNRRALFYSIRVLFDSHTHFA